MKPQVFQKNKSTTKVLKKTNLGSINGYKLVRELGTGATGTVYHAEKNGSEFALKVFI